MENKKMQGYLDLFHSFVSDGTANRFFSGMPGKEKPKYTQLGNGFELRPIKLSEEESKNKNITGLEYSHLYRDGEKISDKIFRKGGIGGEFEDGYCVLIYYTRDPKRESGFSCANFVIINESGEIILKSEQYSSDHPYIDGGNVGHIKNMYYDLRTGEPFMVKSSNVINSKNFIIVEHKYDWYGKELNIPLGIYKIDKETCQFEKIDEIKK